MSGQVVSWRVWVGHSRRPGPVPAGDGDGGAESRQSFGSRPADASTTPVTTTVLPVMLAGLPAVMAWSTRAVAGRG